MSMTEPRTTEVVPLAHPATPADLLSLPETVIGEIIDGTLYVSPRPAGRHARIITSVAFDLYGPFDRGLSGPGGWWILSEPGIDLPAAPEIVPDVAGCRKETLADVSGVINAVPDWVCEVLSPGTRRYDLHTKRPYYARVGVPHMWMVDPETQLLTASRNVDGHWLEIGVWGADEHVRVAPFEAVEIDLSYWWRATNPH